MQAPQLKTNEGFFFDLFPDYPLTIAGRDIPRGYAFSHRESWWPHPSFYILVLISALASGAVRRCFSRFVVAVLFYSLAWTFNTIYLVQQDWFWYPILTFLDGFPSQEIDSVIWWFYGVQIGWYVYCLYAHLFQDTRKSDYWIMIVHHIVTLSLQYGAFSTGYFRVGMLVMFSMDICDVFVFAAKTLKILDKDGCVPMYYYIAAYATLPTVWVSFRLVYFPYMVLHTTLIGTIKIFGWYNTKGWLPFNFLLSILLVLNVFWFYQIVRVGVISLQGKESKKLMDDIREIQPPRSPLTKPLVRPSQPAKRSFRQQKGKAKVAY